MTCHRSFGFVGFEFASNRQKRCAPAENSSVFRDESADMANVPASVQAVPLSLYCTLTLLTAEELVCCSTVILRMSRASPKSCPSHAIPETPGGTEPISAPDHLCSVPPPNASDAGSTTLEAIANGIFSMLTRPVAPDGVCASMLITATTKPGLLFIVGDCTFHVSPADHHLSQFGHSGYPSQYGGSQRHRPKLGELSPPTIKVCPNETARSAQSVTTC